jgi:hypothetical protein
MKRSQRLCFTSGDVLSLLFLDLISAFLNMNVFPRFPSTERFIALLQCAEDIARASQYEQFIIDVDLEPLPIGPQGIEQVVDQVPPLQWNHAFELFSIASCLNGTSFSTSNNLASQNLIHSSPIREKQLRSCRNVSNPLMTEQQKIGLFSNSVPPKIVQEKSLFPSSKVASVVSTDSTSIELEAKVDFNKRRYRSYQKGKWNQRFEDLMIFRGEHGHLFVPHIYPPNQKLSQWVKR